MPAGAVMSEGRYRESEIGLPPLFTLRGFEGSLSEYVEQLYWQYLAMLHDPGILLWGKPVVVSEDVAADGRERCFWHLITDGNGKEEQRKLSLIRCSRLPWVWDILERLTHGDPRVCWWRESRQRLMVAPIDFRMVIVLRVKPRSYYLETAHPIGHKARLRFMQRAAKSWEAAGAEEWRLRQDLAV